MLLDKSHDPNVKDFRGWTALHYTERKDHALVSAILLDRGAKLNEITPGDKPTSQQRAIEGYNETVEMFFFLFFFYVALRHPRDPPIRQLVLELPDSRGILRCSVL